MTRLIQSLPLRSSELHHHRQGLALVERNEKQAELESVQHNRVNIPRNFLAIRVRVCQAAGVDPEAIPFAGELIEVRSEYSDWTGVIERLLRGFGLSLLVPEPCYRRAAAFINSTWLGLRLDELLSPESDTISCSHNTFRTGLQRAAN